MQFLDILSTFCNMQLYLTRTQGYLIQFYTPDHICDERFLRSGFKKYSTLLEMPTPHGGWLLCDFSNFEKFEGFFELKK